MDAVSYAKATEVEDKLLLKVKTDVPANFDFAGVLVDDGSFTKMGGTFNGPNQLVKLTSDGTLPEGFISGLTAPTISIPTALYGDIPTVFTITNALPELTYIVTSDNGSGEMLGASSFFWTFTHSSTARPQELYVKGTRSGHMDTPTLVKVVEVLPLAAVEDQTLLYEGETIANFTRHTNTEEVDDAVVALEIDKTNIVASASTDSFSSSVEILEGDIINVDGSDMVVVTVTLDNSAYTIDTTSITNGSTPTTAYLNMQRAISNKITQEDGETDFKGLGDIEARFEFINISSGSETDLLKTNIDIKDGDNLVIVKEDDSVNEVVASGVSSSGDPLVYSMDTTSTTQGGIPSKVFLIDTELKFKVGE